MDWELDLMDMLRRAGYGDYESFRLASDTIGITPDELSKFSHASEKLSRLEVTQVPWLRKFSDLLECSVSDIVETYRDMRWGGWIYLIFWNDEYKIGKTTSLRDRYAEFGWKYKGYLKVHTIRTNESLILERSLHKRYAEFNTHGEWFVLPNEDIEIIKQVKTVRFTPLLNQEQ